MPALSNIAAALCVSAAVAASHSHSHTHTHSHAHSHAHRHARSPTPEQADAAVAPVPLLASPLALDRVALAPGSRFARAAFEQRIELGDASEPAAAEAAAAAPDLGQAASPAAGEPEWVTARCAAGGFAAAAPLMQRGLVFDLATGDLVKLDARGRVRAAWHGLRRRGSGSGSGSGTDADADADAGAWRGYAALRACARPLHALPMLTGFDAPAQLVVCQCVAFLDAQAQAEAAVAAAAAAAARRRAQAEAQAQAPLP